MPPEPPQALQGILPMARTKLGENALHQQYRWTPTRSPFPHGPLRQPCSPASAKLTSVMPDMIEKRRNWAVWLGFLFALGAMLCNVVLFLGPPGQRAIAWLSVPLAVAALILLARGLQHAFGKPQAHPGKILSSIVSLVSLLLAGLAIFIFFHARALPPFGAAPQVGQKVPDFTLANTTGQPVSLDQLFLPATGNSQGVPPRAVLLIFYRGYW
jgi:hypothetical protein